MARSFADLKQDLLSAVHMDKRPQHLCQPLLVARQNAVDLLKQVVTVVALDAAGDPIQMLDKGKNLPGQDQVRSPLVPWACAVGKETHLVRKMQSAEPDKI